MVSSEMDSLHEVFFEEAEELLAEMENASLTLETTPEDEEILNTIFRCVHSIKGASSMFGFADLSQFAHGFESVLDLLRHHQLAVAQPVADLLLRASDMLKSLLAQIKGEGSVDTSRRDAIVAELESLIKHHEISWASTQLSRPTYPPTVPSSTRVFEIIFKPDSASFHKGVDPADLLARLPRLGDVCDVQVDVSALPPLDQLDPEECYLGWTIQLRTTEDADMVEVMFEEAREGSVLRITEIEPAQAPDDVQSTQKKVGQCLVAPEALSPTQLDQAVEKPQPLRRKQETTSIRVNTEKVDKLINLAGELVITQSMLAQLLAGFTPERLPELEEVVTQMDRHARELQERVMAIRLLPIRTLFCRLPRLVRDLSQAQGKQITVGISGEETELDKTVIEQISDPLTHLVRNAIDHGIELPEVRLQAGKPAAGHLHLKAYQQSGSIYIEVTDDGKGIDRERIAAKAADSGLIASEQTLTDEEIFGLIFRPGFSTAEQVTEVSGRGVGMDVVKRKVEGLNGSITPQSEPGHGTTIKIKLPLTLAILDGQLLQVGGESYVLPLVAIVESMRPRRESLNRMLGEAEVITSRGQVLPLLRLHRLLGVTPRSEDPTQALVVIAEHDGHKIALLVDELLGQQQVVIKSLEANFRKIAGIAGATILGDGRVALILDVPGLVRLATAGAETSQIRGASITIPFMGEG